MKFILRETDGETIQDSDYDTAVDLVHTTLTTNWLRLEGADGVRVDLHERRESRQSSTLEPDFDHFEATGEVIHQARPNEDGPDSVSRWATLPLLLVEPVLTVEEWRLWNHFQAEGGLPHPDDEAAQTIRSDQLQHLNAYEDHGFESHTYFGSNGTPLTVPKADLQALWQAADAMAIGEHREVSLSPETEAMLLREAHLQAELIRQDTANRATNQMNQQQANLPAVRASLGERLAQTQAPATATTPAAPAPSLWRRVFRR